MGDHHVTSSSHVGGRKQRISVSLFLSSASCCMSRYCYILFYQSVLFSPPIGLPWRLVNGPIHPCHTAAMLSRGTRGALFYHAEPRNGNHGDETWRGKAGLFCPPGTVWPPCDKGELHFCLLLGLTRPHGISALRSSFSFSVNIGVLKWRN